MGIGKSIKKAVKNSVKNLHRGGSMWQFAEKIGKQPTDAIKDALGLGALQDMASAQEAALNAQGERAKLDAMSEVQNITQFDDSAETTFAGSTGNRRKRQKAGGFGSGVGIIV